MVAPDELMRVIRCNCKITSRNPCGSNLCSCRQNGLSCVAACGECKGVNCNNVSAYAESDEDGEDDNVFV